MNNDTCDITEGLLQYLHSTLRSCETLTLRRVLYDSCSVTVVYTETTLFHSSELLYILLGNNVPSLMHPHKTEITSKRSVYINCKTKELGRDIGWSIILTLF